MRRRIDRLESDALAWRRSADVASACGIELCSEPAIREATRVALRTARRLGFAVLCVLAGGDAPDTVKFYALRRGPS